MNIPKVLIQLMLAVLFTHELDAMTQSEWRLASDPLFAFNSPLSWSLILGAAALGAAYLGLAARATNALFSFQSDFQTQSRSP